MNSTPRSRNPWPLGVAAAFAVFIAGTAGLIAIACAHRTELVSPDYYEQEIRFQSQIDRRDRAQRLNTRLRVSYDETSRRLMISLPPEHARREAAGSIQLYRPSAAGLDRRTKLEVDSSGAQSLDAASLRPGPWKVRVSWRVGDQEYFAEQRVVIGD